MKEKIVKILSTIFGYGIMITLFAGGLSFFGYLAALCIGGETATRICTFIYKQYFPVVFIVTALLILLGLIRIYISKEHTFTANMKKRVTDKEKEAEEKAKAEAEVKAAEETVAEEAVAVENAVEKTETARG